MNDTAQRTEVATFEKPRLPFHPAIEERFGDLGINKATWKALVDAIFPAAKSVDSVVLALSYCKARRLDPFKRPVHIVPIWNKDERRYMDTVWPGITELRTTAMRTGQFAGCDEADCGPEVEREFKSKDNGKVTVRFPEWCRLTVYKMIGGQRVPVAGPKVYWLETYGKEHRDSEAPNEMWRRRPRGQLEKCAEAAALRRAFPEEIGGDYIAEEAERIEVRTIEARALTPPGEAPAKRPERTEYRDRPAPEASRAPIETGRTEDYAAWPAERWDDFRTELTRALRDAATIRELASVINNAEPALTVMSERSPDNHTWIVDLAEKRRAQLNAPEAAR